MTRLSAAPAHAVLDLSEIDRLIKEAEAEGETEEVDILDSRDPVHPVKASSSGSSSSGEGSSISGEGDGVGGGPVATLLLPEDNVSALSFVAEEAGRNGVNMTQEEIAPRVFYPAAQKVIYRVRVNALQWIFCCQ